MFVSVGESEGTTSQSLLSSALLSVECAQLLNHYEGSLGIIQIQLSLLDFGVRMGI